jgi:pimeloyl-ACP methyl ester carboxylesterase
METTSRIVRCPDGRALKVTEGGDPKGWPIIVHHGTPLSSRLYPGHVLLARDRGIRLISYDRPGYGESDALPGRRVADAATDVSIIADALGISRFAVWGHSGGGSHALACAALLPGRVSAAAASAGVAPYGAKGLDWLEGMGSANLDEFSAALAGRESLDRFLQPQWLAMQKGDEEISPELRTLLSPGDLELLVGELGVYLTVATKEGFGHGPAGWIDDDLEDVAPWGFDVTTIRIPTSIWHGKLDRFVPFRHAIWLAGHIPGSELKLFDDETHLTFFHRRATDVFEWLMTRSQNPLGAHQ